MRKKELIGQNLALFEELEKSQAELAKLKELLNKNAEEINILKAKLEENKADDNQATVTEPMRRREEKIIANATLKPDMEYASKAIGKIVVVAAKYSNKLTVGGDDSKLELVNLILGKTEMAKAEILSVIEGENTLDVKCDKIDQIVEASTEYFKSVAAQIV